MTKVLVVEDEREVRHLLTDTLTDAGYETIEADNGGGALARVEQDSPDVIILDVMMPVMDGIEVLGKLRANPDTEHLPVVLLTAYPALKGEQTAMELGVSHYITKPWSIGTIEPAVKVALREAGAQGAPEGSRMTRVGTGNTQMDQRLEGGLPIGSLTLIEGTSSAGKSVICKQVVYDSLRKDYQVACFNFGRGGKTLISDMATMGLHVSEYVLQGKLKVRTPKERGPDDNADDRLTSLLDDMQNLPREYDVIIVDPITTLASYSSAKAVLGFFSACKRLCDEGRTIIVAAHTHSFEREMLMRLRALCDAHLRLSVEKMGTKLLKMMEVCKILGAEVSPSDTVCFVVEPGEGIRVSPMSSVKV